MRGITTGQEHPDVITSVFILYMKNTLITIIVTAVVVAGGMFALEATSKTTQALGGDVNRFKSGVTNDKVSVLSSTTEVAAANTSRQYLAIINDSANVVYLGLGEAAVSGEGIRLNASGGTFEINSANLFTGAINGISSATSSVTIVEK